MRLNVVRQGITLDSARRKTGAGLRGQTHRHQRPTESVPAATDPDHLEFDINAGLNGILDSSKRSKIGAFFEPF